MSMNQAVVGPLEELFPLLGIEILLHREEVFEGHFLEAPFGLVQSQAGFLDIQGILRLVSDHVCQVPAGGFDLVLAEVRLLGEGRFDRMKEFFLFRADLEILVQPVVQGQVLSRTLVMVVTLLDDEVGDAPSQESGEQDRPQ